MRFLQIRKLHFTAHIQQIVDKGVKTLGFMLRITKNIESLNGIKLSYTNVVRSLIEHNPIGRSPFHNIHLHNEERMEGFYSS